MSESSGSYFADKRVLLELVRVSRILDAGVWVDGVYTVLDEVILQSDWMNGHEVYFKIEGRIEEVQEKPNE